MKMRMLFVMLAALFIPGLCAAQSVFDGTWKVDINSASFPEKPGVYLLQDGMYHCKTCVPPINIKADGTDQKVTGQPYYDTISVKIIDDHTTEEIDKKNGKIVGKSRATVSADGNTLVFEFTDTSASNADPVTGKGESTRMAKGPAGSHLTSGSWRMKKMDSESDNGLTFTIRITGDSLSMTSPTGQGYTAKLDGTEAPYIGDPGTTSVSVKKLGAITLEETDKRNGKPFSVTRYIISADGKSLRIVSDDKLQGTHTEAVANKQ